MKDDSLYKLGSICSFLVGISYVVIGITTLLQSRALTVLDSSRKQRSISLYVF
jgi:hypothetical protein